MKILLLLSSGIAWFFIRWSRWLALVQQKEYRWDRLKLFLKSDEGQSELLKLWFGKKHFTKTGLKRPRLTSRVLIVAGLSAGLMVWWWLLTWVAVMLFEIHNPWLVGSVWITSLLGMHLLLPGLVFISVVPTVWVAEWQTQQVLKKAEMVFKQHHPLVIGITGSYGKTTSKQLLAHVLATEKKVFVTPRSFNTLYSAAKAIVDGYDGEEIAVVEYAAYASGEIARLARVVQPNWAVITGFAPQHLGLFGSEAAIATAKAELITAVQGKGVILINAADNLTQQICQAAGVEIGQATPRVRAYSGSSSMVQFHHQGVQSDGTLSFVWKGHTVQTKLLGQLYLPQVMLAISAARELGISEHNIVSGLESFQPSEAFIQKTTGKNGVIIINDAGTSNPVGFAAALNLLKTLQTGKKNSILITAGIVDLGKKSGEIHGRLAEQAAHTCDEVWYVGEHELSVFEEHLGESLFAIDSSGSTNQLRQLLAELDSNTLILLEGKLPQWLLQELGIKI